VWIVITYSEHVVNGVVENLILSRPSEPGNQLVIRQILVMLMSRVMIVNF
jgi:hypothetical protein